jgi:hypothetical protein
MTSMGFPANTAGGRFHIEEAIQPKQIIKGEDEADAKVENIFHNFRQWTPDQAVAVLVSPLPWRGLYPQ